MSTPEHHLQGLRDEIAKLVSEAAQVEADHRQVLRLVAEEHAKQVDELVESARLLAIETDNQHAADRRDIEHVKRALLTRDLIGQAKGILAITLGCTPDEGFALMVTQSQHENRKLVDIAQEVVARIERRAHGGAPVAQSP